MLVVLYVVLTLLISGLYIFLIIYILEQWSSITDYPAGRSKPNISRLRITVLIPARNEAENIEACLAPLVAQSDRSPHEIELIVIDDHSDDKTVELVQQLSSDIIIIQLQDILKGSEANAYKKVALAEGIARASGDYIIQLDADVVVPKHYLEQISAAIAQEKPDFMACPVIMKNHGSILGHFQTLDFLGMMALTGAGIQGKSWYMANGANMVYKKNLASFHDDPTASGDDISTIQQISKDASKKVCFLKNKDAAVVTEVEPSLASFYKQRIRWATKNKAVKNSKTIFMMAVPFLNAWWLLFHLVSWYIIGPIALSVGCFHLFTKMAIDYIYLQDSAQFFDEENSLKYFIPSFFIHLCYIALIGLASLVVKNYEWKGRQVS